MTKRSLTVATVLLVAVIAIGAVLVYFFGPEHRHVQTASQAPVVSKAQVGQPAPSFEVSSTAGLFDLGKATKPVFLEVFATWCPHCQREAAVVDRLYRKYGSHVEFIGVSGSDNGMDGASPASELDVLNWARRFKVAYPVAYDPLQNVANLYLQGGFPTFAIVGRNKKIAYLDSGEIAYNDLDSALNKAVSGY
jgi:cytochrome c biogenesis protein CcmG/thiol:disulfide interchange protein DsbE